MNQTKSVCRGVCTAPIRRRSGFLLPALLISCCLAWACPAPAVAQCQYEAVVIEGPQHEWFSAIVIGRGLNDSGEVVGEWRWPIADYPEAFYWTEEKGMLTLPRPAGVIGATASDLNEHGQIAGSHMIEGQGWTGFVFDLETGAFAYLVPKHEGVVAHTVSSANAINNAGIVAGSRVIGAPDDPAPLPFNAVIWDTNTGEVTDLSVGDGPSSGAMDISENGDHVVGWANGSGPLFGQAAIWTDDQLHVIGPLPGTDNSIVNAVSESGIAVGSGLAQSPVVWRAFIWDGTLTIIDPIDDWQHVRAEATNNLGQAFLFFSKPSQIHVPVLWQHGDWHYVNSLLVPSHQEINLTAVAATNDQGQAVCAAVGNFAVVLTPIDPPLTDLNVDCVTDVHDLLMLLDAWGPVPRSSNAPADINGDGVVDVFDLLILLDNWTMPERR